MSAVNADELQNPVPRMLNRHIDVDVHPIDAFQLQQHRTAQNLRHALCRSKIQSCRLFATQGSVINSISGEIAFTSSSVWGEASLVPEKVKRPRDSS